MNQRILESELMDDPSLSTDRLELALRELSLINRWLGGYRTTVIGFESLLRHIPPGRSISVIDIGSGGTDLRNALSGLDRTFDLIAFDINPRSLASDQHQQNPPLRVVGTAHALPFKDASIDIVHLSLFLHHCTDSEALSLLQSSLRIARQGVVINDLHRHRLAYAAIRILTRLFSRSAIVRHDAPVSVRRGFTRNELTALAEQCSAVVERCSWQWAFRWCLCLRKAVTRAYG